MPPVTRLDALIEELELKKVSIEEKLQVLRRTQEILRLDHGDHDQEDHGNRGGSKAGSDKPAPSGTRNTPLSTPKKISTAEADRRLTGSGSSSNAGPKSAEPSKGLKAVSERVGETKPEAKPEAKPDRRELPPDGKLPDDPERYFNVNQEGVERVPLDKLLTIRARAKGIENAEKHMAKAYMGEGQKRDPISVSKNDDGTYSVEDGNSTVAIARKNGWAEMPVKVVEQSDKGKAAYGEHKIKRAMDDIRELQENGRIDPDTGKLLTLPKDFTPEQHREIAERELAKHKENLGRFKSEISEVAGVEFNGRTKTTDSALGKVVRKPKYGSADKLGDLTGVRAVTKTVAQSKEVAKKIAEKYNVPAKDIEEKLEAHQVREGGYRAIHMTITDSDGLVKEVQIQTERQRAFQEWSHDVYKPQNAAQTELVGTDTKPGPFRREAMAYGEAMSEYFYAKDLGREATRPPRPHPKILSVFGEPREI